MYMNQIHNENQQNYKNTQNEVLKELSRTVVITLICKENYISFKTVEIYLNNLVRVETTTKLSNKTAHSVNLVRLKTNTCWVDTSIVNYTCTI